MVKGRFGSFFTVNRRLSGSRADLGRGRPRPGVHGLVVRLMNCTELGPLVLQDGAQMPAVMPAETRATVAAQLRSGAL